MQQLLELNNLLHSGVPDIYTSVAQRLTDHTADWCLICQLRGSALAFEAIGHADDKRRDEVKAYIQSRTPPPDVNWLQNWDDPHITKLTGLNAVTTIPIQGRAGLLGYLSVGLADEKSTLDPDAMLLLQNTALSLAGLMERNTLRNQIYGLDNTVHAERGRMNTILQFMPVGVLLTDAQTHQPVLINQEMERLRGDSFELRYTDDTPLEPEEEPLTRAFAGETVHGLELSIVHADNKQVPIIAGAVPLRDTGGEIEGAILTWQDISNLKDAQNTRELLLTGASHELRTPLTSLLGFIQLLETRPDAQPERRAKWLSYISEKARFLAQLVEELINLSRAQSGWLKLAIEKADMRELLETALAEARSSDTAHDYLFNVPNEPVVTLVDRQKILQVVQQLLANAATYSGSDTRIELTLGQDTEWIRITVRDYGMGISLEEQQHIFLPFYRAEAAYKFPGTGLGLSIANSFIDLHHGRLWVQSTGIPGEGSLFIVELPLL